MADDIGAALGRVGMGTQMTPLAIGMPGLPELIIILVVVLLLFGGTRLAGLGKSTGRAIKEFKDETKGLRDKKDEPTGATGTEEPPSPPNAADSRHDS